MKKTKKVIATGKAGREAPTGVPSSLEFFLQNHKRVAAGCHRTGYDLVRELFGAIAIVKDGHVHIGLLHPDALAFVGARITAATEMGVVYHYGAAWIHAKEGGATPVLIAGVDHTAWDFTAEHPTRIRRASFYYLGHDGLKLFATKPAQGVYADED